MSSLAIGLLGICLLLIFLMLGLHIGISLMLSGLIGLILILHGITPALTMTVGAFYHKVTAPTLVTVPLFILMGFLASGGGISKNIYDSLKLWLGKFRSGLGIATVFACTGFGTVCGSSLVTSSVFAKISAPEMRRTCGYDKKLAYAICASAGSIGMLIPPSILIVVYGILSGQSVGRLLIAGVAPGILLAIAFSLTIILLGKIKPSLMGDVSNVPSAPWSAKIASLKHWWTVIIVAFVILGGIYGGVFSPSEAAAVAAFILLIIYLLITLVDSVRRKGILKELLVIFSDTATTSAMIFFLMGSATVFSDLITMSGVTKELSNVLLGADMPQIMVVLMMVFVVGILGCFLDSMSVLCVTVPVFNPIITTLGIDPIWYATVIILAVEVGLITPPFGLNVFATKGVAEPDVRLEDIFGGVLPFFIAMLVVLGILLGFPVLSTFLPSYIG